MSTDGLDYKKSKTNGSPLLFYVVNQLFGSRYIIAIACEAVNKPLFHMSVAPGYRDRPPSLQCIDARLKCNINWHCRPLFTARLPQIYEITSSTRDSVCMEFGYSIFFVIIPFLF